jgi:PPOX class probable F420-dependent enzyme
LELSRELKGGNVAELTDAVKRFLEQPYLAHFVTIMKDGSPQVTPVWVDHDGTHVLINTAEGRQKPRNLRRNPQVALSVAPEAQPYQWVQIRGRVVDITSQGAGDHICKLSEKYTGDSNYAGSLDDRIIVKVLPEHITARGLEQR